MRTECLFEAAIRARDASRCIEKMVRAAVLRICGMNAVIQRCQLHKIRNVEGHLAKKHRPEARRRMNKAYAQKVVDTAKRLLGETVT